MLKNFTRLESVVEGKTGQFFVEYDTPLHFVKEMLFQFQKYIGQIEDSVRSQQEAAKEESKEEVNEPDCKTCEE